jgi:hypothetical protein
VCCPAASTALSAILEGYHAARGTAVLTVCLVRAFLGARGRLRAVSVASDNGPDDSSVREVACDVAVVGVGAVPRDELARAAGLACDNGVVVDGGARTGDPRILAIGDVTSRAVSRVGDRMRLESIPVRSSREGNPSRRSWVRATLRPRFPGSGRTSSVSTSRSPGAARAARASMACLLTAACSRYLRSDHYNKRPKRACGAAR